MSQALRDYLLTIIAVCLLLTVVLAMIPKGTIRRIGAMVGGLLVILTVMSPLGKIDSDSISRAISRFSLEIDAVHNGIEIGSRELLCQVISEKCETYILDKADSLAMKLQVDIILNEDAEYPYPVSVTLRGSWSPAEQRLLSAYITEGLGIPADRQEWLLM